jgi:hypothetical protein
MAMNRRTGIFLAACWVTMALSGVDLRAQDTSRVPDTNPEAASAVDASVHADVQEGTKQQPQPAQQSNKRPASYSKWGFPSASQSPGTQFRPGQPTSVLASPTTAQHLSTLGGPSSRATDSRIAPTTDAKSTRPDRQLKPDWQSDPFGVSPANSQHDFSKVRQRFDAQVQPLSAQPQSSGFSTPFHGNEFGGISSASFPNPFPKTYSSSQDQAEGKKNKSLRLKSGEKPHAGATIGSSGHQKKKVGSQLATRPE